MALVNVDFGPGTVLGMLLIGSGVALYQVRTMRPEVSRDYDVFFSSLGLLCGGILVFQGWRLDPLLFFGQLMTAGTAISFAVEAVRLRSEMQEMLDSEGPPTPRGRGGSGRGGGDTVAPRRGLPSRGDAAFFDDTVADDLQDRGSEPAAWTRGGRTSANRGRRGSSRQSGGGGRGGGSSPFGAAFDRERYAPRSSGDDIFDWPVTPTPERPARDSPGGRDQGDIVNNQDEWEL